MAGYCLEFDLCIPCVTVEAFGGFDHRLSAYFAKRPAGIRIPIGSGNQLCWYSLTLLLADTTDFKHS